MDEIYTKSSTEVLVTILITTYKHSTYIAQCLDSVVQQKTNFRCEVLVGAEEGDTDTIDICLEYQHQYPDLVKVHINSKENVLLVNGQRTGRFNFLNILSKANGKYIARCEGDDYWIDIYKLQKQVDFLEQNQEYAGACHNTIVTYENNTQKAHLFRDSLLHTDTITAEDTIAYIAPFHTSSFFFRRIATSTLPEWFLEINSGDMALFSIIASFGYIKNVMGAMSVYRKNNGGITKTSINTDIVKYNSHRIKLVNYLNEYYNYKYSQKANQVISQYQNAIDQYNAKLNGGESFYYKFIKKLQSLMKW